MKNNLYLKSLIVLMLTCASFHMILLIFFAVINADATYLNLFSILELNLIFTNVGEGTVSQFLSLLTVIILYTAIYLFEKNKAKS